MVRVAKQITAAAAGYQTKTPRRILVATRPYPGLRHCQPVPGWRSAAAQTIRAHSVSSPDAAREGTDRPRRAVLPEQAAGKHQITRSGRDRAGRRRAAGSVLAWSSGVLRTGSEPAARMMLLCRQTQAH